MAKTVAQDATIKPVAYMTVTKVIRESVPLCPRAGYGESIGQMVDQYIDTALQNGDELQTVAVEFDTEHWNAMRANA